MSAKNPGISNASPDELSRILQDKLPGADTARALALDDFELLRTARAAGLRSEHKRLRAELGDDHPRLVRLREKLAANHELIKDLTIEKERARVVMPEPKKNSWTLHGFARDRDLRGIAGVTVALYDADGHWIRQLGYASTSPDGNFQLQARTIPKLDSPVFAHVLTSQGTHLHTDNVELTPEAGVVLYHEIIVSGMQAGTPPGESPDDPVADPNVWTVRGRVADKSGNGLNNLVVSLYDKDLLFDDLLGETKTDENGEFSFAYYTDDFRDLIEKRPDIYVKVLDEKGKTIYTSKKKLRYEAGRIEIVDITIDESGKK